MKQSTGLPGSGGPVVFHHATSFTDVSGRSLGYFAQMTTLRAFTLSSRGTMKSVIGVLLALALFIPDADAQNQLSYGTDLIGNLMVPTSSFSDAFGTGFGGSLGVFFDVEENLRVTLSGGYLSAGVSKSGIQKLYMEAGGTGMIQPSGSIKTIPLMLGLQLITPGPLRVYGSLEAGIYVYNVNVSAVISDNTGSSNVQLADETRTELGVNFGFGALFPIKDDVSVTAGVKYHLVKTSDFRSTAGGASALTLSTNQFLTFGLGLNWAFPTGS